MNKREKAVWNIVILISVILIGVFSYLILSNFTIRNKNIENFRFSLKNAGKYSLPIDNSNVLIGFIEKYDLNINDVIESTHRSYRYLQSIDDMNDFDWDLSPKLKINNKYND